MTSITTTSLSWDEHVTRALARITDDIVDRSDRFSLIAMEMDSKRVYAQTSTVGTAQRLFARAFHKVMFAVCAAAIVTTVAKMPDPDTMSALATAVGVVVIVTAIGAPMGLWMWLTDLTYDYRSATWLHLDREESYRWFVRDQARKEIAALSTDRARAVLVDLEAMTDGIEELILERATLLSALDIDRRWATTTFLDREDADARLAVVTTKLNQVTAVFTAAASSLTAPKTTVTAPDSAPVKRTRVETVLDGQTQVDLDAAIARVKDAVNG